MSRKRETTKYNTADLIQARQIMAESMHRDSAREKRRNVDDSGSPGQEILVSATPIPHRGEIKMDHPISGET